MGSNSLLGVVDTSIDRFNSQEEVKHFLSYARNANMYLRLDMHNEDGTDLEYTRQQVLIDGSYQDMVDQYYAWYMAMPSLESIIDIVVEGLYSIDSYDDNAIIEQLMEDTRTQLSEMGLYGEDLDKTESMLEDLAEDMYNYLALTLTNFSIVRRESLWNFLKCVDASMENGKLYITMQIYEDKLNSVDLFGELYDRENYLETASEIKDLYHEFVNRSLQKTTGNRSRNDDLIGSLHC